MALTQREHEVLTRHEQDFTRVERFRSWLLRVLLWLLPARRTWPLLAVTATTAVLVVVVCLHVGPSRTTARHHATPHCARLVAAPRTAARAGRLCASPAVPRVEDGPIGMSGG